MLSSFYYIFHEALQHSVSVFCFWSCSSFRLKKKPSQSLRNWWDSINKRGPISKLNTIIFITSLKTHGFKANSYWHACVGGLVLNSFPLCFALLHTVYLLLLHRVSGKTELGWWEHWPHQSWLSKLIPRTRVNLFCFVFGFAWRRTLYNITLLLQNLSTYNTHVYL